MTKEDISTQLQRIGAVTGPVVYVDEAEFEQQVDDLTARRAIREPKLGYLGGELRHDKWIIKRIVDPDQELHPYDGPKVTDTGHVLALHQLEEQGYQPMGVVLYEGAKELNNMERIVERASRRFINMAQGVAEAPPFSIIVTNRNLPTLNVPHTFTVMPENAFFVNYQR